MAYDPNNPLQRALVDLTEFRIDQLTTTGQTPAINHDLIYSELQKAARIVLERVPNNLVYTAGVAKPVTWHMDRQIQEHGRFYVLVPEDFIRFLRIHLSHPYQDWRWHSSVYDLLDPRSNAYRLQLNPNSQAGLTAPQAALVPYYTAYIDEEVEPPIVEQYHQAIECFPPPPYVSGAKAYVMLEYVPVTAPEEMPSRLQDAVVWYAAYSVAVSVRAFEAAGAAEKSFQQTMSALNIGMKGEEVPSL
jgi:hypothetical protein